MKVTKAPNDKNLIVDSQNVENVEELNCLGAVLINKVDDTKEARRRIAMAKTAMIFANQCLERHSFHNVTRNDFCKHWYSE